MSPRVPKKLAALTHEVSETGEVVIFDQKGNQLLLLNDVGAAVWLLINGARSVDAIVDLIVETLPSEREQVARDVGAFLGSLSEHGLVELGP